MKKIFLFMSFAIVVGMTSAFAGKDPKVGPRVQQSFKKEFPAADFVKWDKDQDYFKATFVLNDYRTEAWFSEEGELLGTVRNLLYDQLPLAVMRGIEKKYSAEDIIEIREITNADGTTYKMTAINKKGKFGLSATPDGDVVRTGKIKN
ncbi:MAG TPA: hypothetical protein VHD35_06045 [Chitinophagaceae bacterium]|nr:hypothetical protein [Chitinophagaceae bacterium]